ncbi:MAG TPA: hypothetical protein VHR66_33060 [Gemmataceae bacterium]|jgi:hypothetical protein|nr:hypothetical protein [Gemmataceae bacterium]
MELKADLAFGTEPITIGEVTQTIEVCKLADDLEVAAAAVQEGKTAVKNVLAEGVAANAVFAKYGFPAMTEAAAVKFANEVCFRAVTLGKEAGSVWTSSVDPALPSDFLDSTLPV